MKYQKQSAKRVRRVSGVLLYSVCPLVRKVKWKTGHLESVVSLRCRQEFDQLCRMLEMNSGWNRRRDENMKSQLTNLAATQSMKTLPIDAQHAEGECSQVDESDKLQSAKVQSQLKKGEDRGMHKPPQLSLQRRFDAHWQRFYKSLELEGWTSFFQTYSLIWCFDNIGGGYWEGLQFASALRLKLLLFR